ncbi:CatB-related O-acetyltransferase [Aerococcus urinaeequi]|uniref:CatB-related O-acetyltransferase n=1 Tax=Aerococcus urinaeequi TaxID=51665 RepID=UPI00288D0A8B|nr:CatB-related O-acetyltransferase [Aerococcus urinaeequi]MDT2761848.1 CatB-related O-acetyltransferase [Aerococcus urinaeequi]
MVSLKKVMFRLFRIITGKKGIYGKIGLKNKFTRSVYVSEDACIGNYNYFGPFSMINNASIGNYCSIGPGVKIGQGDHSKDFITTYQSISKKLIDHSLNSTKSVLGSDVWVGANAVILQNVNIGNGAIIGANSVVTKDIPDYAIAVGVPAKIIKYRFSDEKIKLINKSKWYDYEMDLAIEIIKSLNT